jgi:hypothetical protein
MGGAGSWLTRPFFFGERQASMAIAPYEIVPRGEFRHRAPAGGCWVLGTDPAQGRLKGFDGGTITGQPPNSYNRPPLFYPAGYPLPAGTTQYAQEYTATNFDRIIQRSPPEYESRSSIRYARRLERARIEAEGLGRAGGWTQEAIDRYTVATAGPAPREAEIGWDAGFGDVLGAQGQVLIRGGNVDIFGRLRPGEVYLGRPAMVVFNVGTIASVRLRQVRQLWSDIELAMKGSP